MAPPQRVVVNQGQRDMLIIHELSALLNQPLANKQAHASRLAVLLPSMTQKLVVAFITGHEKHHQLLGDLLCIL
jgi:hypothetical protein